MKYKITDFSILWRITTACNNRCKHCYIYDRATYGKEKKNELNVDTFIKILDSVCEFEKKYGAVIGRYDITGGDPLLKEGWKFFITELRKRNKEVNILGNPDTLTDENIKFLSDAGVRTFQMSLDGMEHIHDSIRGKGSFRLTVDKISKLKEYGIHSNINFTLSHMNKHEIFQVIDFVSEQTVARGMSFDIMSPVGNMEGLMISQAEVIEIFTEFIEKKKKLIESGNPFILGERTPFYNLIRFEHNDYFPLSSEEIPVITGCRAGWAITYICSDGSVMACWRFPLIAGKMPEQSFEDVFLGSEELRKFRRPEYYEQCGICDFYLSCRGCPAIACKFSGSPFGENPLCFRDKIKRETEENSKILRDVPLNTTYEEEYDFIASSLYHSSRERFIELMDDEEALKTIITLYSDRKALERYMKNPVQYFSEESLSVDDTKKVLINFFMFKLLHKTSTHVGRSIIDKLSRKYLLAV
ncbi:MAG: radical SAM protein [Candidatus Eremiobacterota bacterium]